MVNLFGNEGALIGSMELLFGALFILGAFIFRKSVANDMMDYPFSVIASGGLGTLTFIILNNIISNIRISVGISLMAWAAAGFLLGKFLPDGEAGGN
jgi:hypothetical protein